MKKSCSLLKPHELQRDQNNDDSTISTLIKKSCFKYFANDSTNFSTVLLNTQSLIDSNLSQPTTLQPTTVLVHQPQINYSFNQEQQQQQQHQQNYKLKENYNHTTDELMQNNTYQNLNMFNNKILNERASPNHSNSDLNLIKQSENNLFINNNTHNEYQNTTVNFLNYKSSILNSSSDDLFGLHENNVVDLADDLSSCNQQNFIELITATKDSNLSFINHNHNQVSYYGNTCV